MVDVNKYPEWADICFLRIMWRSERIKKDPGSDKRPSQLRMAREFCFSLKIKIGKQVRTTAQQKLALQP